MIPENKFQSKVIRSLKIMFPLGIILKNDPNYIQGIPDLLILDGNRWFALETKKSKNAHSQPNQKYYVDIMNHMSFARIIYPENFDEVLDDIQRSRYT